MPKPWPAMSRHERLVALDEIEAQLKIALDKMARDVTYELRRRQVPFTVDIVGHLVVTDNRLDPRLPDTGVFG